MAKQKTDFNPIIYEVGDEVICIYADDPRNKGTLRSRVQVINDTKIVTTSEMQYQLISFLREGGWEVSNHYKPYGATIEKYKDGLNYLKPSITNFSFANKSKKKTKVKQVEIFEEEEEEIQPFIFKLPKRKEE